ncbi:Cellulose synthase protein G1 [Theobroma cacao]|uniref:Cellulose synthase protein G1 n=1 Tax=Theobroma cacao TaxID=3641 RepID=A0A061G5F8_THECC|nr:Cellulose synthase protein G1 [Theobroma cacao]
MEALGRRGHYTSALAPTDAPHPFHTVEHLRHMVVNRVFVAVYTCAILALLYRHVRTLFLHSTTLISFFITLSLLFSDLVLAFMWGASQAFRMYPIRHKQIPENLKKSVKEQDFSGLDVFICTADPHKEPLMSVVNMALLLMAYDYPMEKISIYVSDDGGSPLTLFAFMEAAKFASHWLPFCRENNIMDRNPDVYFASGHSGSSKAENIKDQEGIQVFLLPVCIVMVKTDYQSVLYSPLPPKCAAYGRKGKVCSFGNHATSFKNPHSNYISYLSFLSSLFSFLFSLYKPVTSSFPLKASIFPFKLSTLHRRTPKNRPLSLRRPNCTRSPHRPLPKSALPLR